jgi:hypothetical protein
MTRTMFPWLCVISLMVGAETASAEGTPAPSDGQSVEPKAVNKSAKYSAEFTAVSTQVRVIVGKRSDRFSEITQSELEAAQAKLVIVWKPTELVDLECPDERTDQTEVRRPFCLRSDGKTMIMSSTYFEFTRKNDRDRMALVAGVLLRVAEVRGSANRAIALRVADVAQEMGYSSTGGGAPLPPNADPLHGLGRIAVGAGVAAAHEKGIGLGQRSDVSFDLQVAMRGATAGGSQVGMYGTFHGKVGEANGKLVYNIDAHGEISYLPVIVGLWLAVKVNQFETYREGFFNIGLPLLSIPVQLGGEDYFLIKSNIGAIPLYSLGNGSKPGMSEFDSQEILFKGLFDVNAEVIIKTGAFFINFYSEFGKLRDENNGKESYTRFEFNASLGAHLELLLPHDEITLEARHTQLKSDDEGGIPGIGFSISTLGVRYGLKW